MAQGYRCHSYGAAAARDPVARELLGADEGQDDNLYIATQRVLLVLDLHTLVNDFNPPIAEELECIQSTSSPPKSSPRYSLNVSPRTLAPLLSTRLLAVVGSDWRGLAIATPRLWSRIYLHLDPKRSKDASGNIQLFQRWIDRSGGCPLSTHIFCAIRRGDTSIPYSIPPVLLHALNGCSSRWQDIDFLLPVVDFRRLETRGGLPVLRKLSVCAAGQLPEVPMTIFSNAPALRHVSLRWGNFALPMGQLHCFRPSSLSMGHLFHVLREAPNLVELGTQVDNKIGTHASSVPDVQLNSLRSLTLRLRDGGRIVLDSLTCPGLETLSVNSFDHSPIPANLSRFISRSSLRFLSIPLPQSHSEPALPSNELQECLSSAPPGAIFRQIPRTRSCGRPI
ncbi:hypothetical protein FB45DRAFT_156043 [Roridomyces roridus]|uniref:F-box domain-containing protein n=1 Tax=Roridomyces roridus TaxID=1738132 RepID=A0AAD7BFF0_9AGAR|nr:hypothetical protein FB45DRAFT_156043 [Roridomyces roridus]